MIELLYSFCFFFGIAFIGFIKSKVHKIIKLIIVFFQLVIIYVYWIKYFTQPEVILKYELIHELPFNPIIHLSPKSGDDLIKIEKLNNKTYSLKKDINFSKKCSPYFYINEIYECPITDIIIENNKSFIHEGYNEIKLEDNKYLYFTNKNMSGRLYRNISYYSSHNYLTNNESDYLSLESFKKKKQLEDLKLSNPYTTYYHYGKYAYCFLTVISLCLLFYNSCEAPNPRTFCYLKQIGYTFDIIELLIMSIGLLLFENLKQFIFNEDNMDLLNSLGYVFNFNPNFNFNLENIALSMEIAKIFIEILYIISPKGCCICRNICIYSYTNDKFFCWNQLGIFFLALPLWIKYAMFFIKDIQNDIKIKKNYEHLKYNWKTNPIYNIEISPNKDYVIGKISTKKEEYKLYKWKNTTFKINRLDNFNYYNIYERKNGKLCGKDSFGNNLYFPEYTECPINDIIITYKPYIEGYNKLLLGDNYTYLHYTNKKIENNIIIDLRASYSYDNYHIQLNLDKTNDLCYFLYFHEDECKNHTEFTSIPFYKILDEWKSSYFIDINQSFYTHEDYISLYSIYYLGIDSDIVRKREKISGFEKYMDIFNLIDILKYISIIINIFAFIYISTVLLRSKNNRKHYNISVFLLILLIGIIYLYFISININIKYIKGFIEKISYDFGKNKNEYIFSISIFLYEILLFSILLSATIFTICFKKNSTLNKNNNRQKCRIRIIKEGQKKNNERPPANLFKNNNNSKDKQNASNSPLQKQKPILPVIKEDKFICIFCNINKSTITLYPCLHRVCCESCYHSIQNTPNELKICPLCSCDVIKKLDDKL